MNFISKNKMITTLLKISRSSSDRLLS